MWNILAKLFGPSWKSANVGMQIKDDNVEIQIQERTGVYLVKMPLTAVEESIRKYRVQQLRVRGSNRRGLRLEKEER